MLPSATGGVGAGGDGLTWAAADVIHTKKIAEATSPARRRRGVQQDATLAEEFELIWLSFRRRWRFPSFRHVEIHPLKPGPDQSARCETLRSLVHPSSKKDVS